MASLKNGILMMCASSGGQTKGWKVSPVRPVTDAMLGTICLLPVGLSSLILIQRWSSETHRCRLLPTALTNKQLKGDAGEEEGHMLNYRSWMVVLVVFTYLPCWFWHSAIIPVRDKLTLIALQYFTILLFFFLYLLVLFLLFFCVIVLHCWRSLWPKIFIDITTL